MNTKRASFLIPIIEEEIILLILKTPKSNMENVKVHRPHNDHEYNFKLPDPFRRFPFSLWRLALPLFLISSLSAHKAEAFNSSGCASHKQQQDSTRQSYTRFLSVYINANIKHEHKRHKNKFYQLKGEEFFSPPSLFVVFVVVFVFVRCLQWSSWWRLRQLFFLFECWRWYHHPANCF